MKIIICSALFFAFSFSNMSAQAIDIHPDHSFSEIFNGDGDEQIVCYKKAHRDIYFGMSALGSLSVLLLIYGYRVKRKANKELNSKNLIIEENNRQIYSSINYARRIQQAILPSDETVSTLFTDSFVLYQPKDIVSGDFYWVNEHNGKAFIAAADCTGHGVPGAMLSVLGNNILNKAINEKNTTQPSEILNLLNRDISKALRQGNNANINDGMDIALCSWDPKNNVLEFSGALNSLFIVSDNILKEVKANRHSIGTSSYDAGEVFSGEQIQLKKGDVFYLVTDGYADQFGGLENKKFKAKQLKNLLQQIAHEPLQKQKNILWDTINSWKGNNEQTDDILIIGVKIK